MSCHFRFVKMLRADVETQDGTKHDMETKWHSMFLVSPLHKGSDLFVHPVV